MSLISPVNLSQKCRFFTIIVLHGILPCSNRKIRIADTFKTMVEVFKTNVKNTGQARLQIDQFHERSIHYVINSTWRM
jgi:hypothetical protein